MFVQRGESAGYDLADILAKPATLANPLCLKADVLYIPKYLLASHEIWWLWENQSPGRLPVQILMSYK